MLPVEHGLKQLHGLRLGKCPQLYAMGGREMTTETVPRRDQDAVQSRYRQQGLDLGDGGSVVQDYQHGLVVAGALSEYLVILRGLLSGGQGLIIMRSAERRSGPKT
jgi:hypothetical protein